MNRQKWILVAVALALMAGTAGLLVRLKANQKLGAPGVKTSPIAGSPRLRVELPETVLDCQSKFIEPDAMVTNTLPKDTSFGQRHYTATDGFQAAMNVVLMGSDRTSMHKPQFCLEGAGWRIERTELATIPVAWPHPYDLPVIRLTVAREADLNGQRATVRGTYVYWFVADHALSADPSGLRRLWQSARSLLTTGVLQRWAYVTCFSVCLPGQEDAAFQRMQRLIAAAVPQFQLASGPPKGGRVATALGRP